MEKITKEAKDWQEFVTLIKKVANEKNISQKEIGNRLGVVQQNISAMFSHKSSPSINKLFEVANIVGVKISISYEKPMK